MNKHPSEKLVDRRSLLTGMGAAAAGVAFSRFKPKASGVWEFKLTQPLRGLEQGTLRVAVKDRQGNRTESVRTFSLR